MNILYKNIRSNHSSNLYDKMSPSLKEQTRAFSKSNKNWNSRSILWQR